VNSRILVVDNYDSFVYNLVQYLAQLDAECTVLRNDEVDLREAAGFDGVLLSPGPGTPEDAGICVPLVRELAEVVIAEGGRIYLAKDAFLGADQWRRMEPRLAEFRRVRERWDPQRRLRSAQSVRLLGDGA